MLSACTFETGEGKSLVLSNACTVMIVYLALSLCTPSSRYARYLPSLSLILGDVTGGPPAEPQRFVGGGRRMAWKAKPSSTTERTTSNLGAILPRSSAFGVSCGGLCVAGAKRQCGLLFYSTPPVVCAHHCTDGTPWPWPLSLFASTTLACC